MTKSSPEQRRSLRALGRLGREPFVAFLRAVRDEGRCAAVEHANKDLDAGTSPEDLFVWDEPKRAGHYLSVRKLDAHRYEIAFGFIAGGLAGDGGDWTVTFGADGMVADIEAGGSVIF